MPKVSFQAPKEDLPEASLALTGAQRDAEVRRLRMQKIDIAKRYATLAQKVKQADLSYRSERNPIMRVRRSDLAMLTLITLSYVINVESP